MVPVTPTTKNSQLIIAFQFIILGNLGMSPANSLLLLAFYNTWAAFLNWVNSLIIDRVGRKPIIITCLVRIPSPSSLSQITTSNAIRR
jgi:hypothetical protein